MSSYAQSFTVSDLPEPGTLLDKSPAFVPVLLKGFIIHPDKPLNFDFIVDSGNDSPEEALIRQESRRMVRYFLAALTVPSDQFWVNLSPYEKDRVIADELGQTELGRDMLGQDYVLRQLTASFMYPEKGLGKEFWAKIYRQAWEKYGTTDIPVDTFNKVWIMPEKAEVFEKGNAVYVTGARLKVMPESDYLAQVRHPEAQRAEGSPVPFGSKPDNAGGPSLAQRGLAQDDVSLSFSQEMAKALIREIILSAIENEVNTGKNFAPLRQIYHAAILAKWYREAITNTLLEKAYVGQNKITGLDLADDALFWHSVPWSFCRRGH